MNPLILIAEDEFKLASVLEDCLAAAGYRSVHVPDGREVVGRTRALVPDLILLDLTLPGRDGLDICREIRTFAETPIIMTTARVEEIDRLLGLDAGADDYICKPFSLREVIARVRVILRRSGNATSAESTGLKFDETSQRVFLNEQWLELTAVELRLLKLLASSPGRIFSRDQLRRRLYTDNRHVTERTVDSHVKNLRRKLEQANPDRAIVRSVYGYGYKLEP